MNLEVYNNLVNHAKNKFIENFIKELQNYLEKDNYIHEQKEDISLMNNLYNDNKIITKYRDKMLIERSNILNDYAKKTLDKGEMYYIYSENSKIEDRYNLCVCEKNKNHNIIEVSRDNLPSGAEVGSVLRKTEDSYILDKDATKEIAEEIYKMKTKLLEEQTEFLESKRIEGHIYEMSENDYDRAWLFDITNGSNEGVEEIEFPTELLKDSKEGDLFIYKDAKYQKI